MGNQFLKKRLYRILLDYPGVVFINFATLDEFLIWIRARRINSGKKPIIGN
jgi:hypothetical protein